MDGGSQAAFDLEGIDRDTSIRSTEAGDFIVCQEGNGSSNPNLLIRVASTGAVTEKIELPNIIDPAAAGSMATPGDPGTIRGNGFEGCAVSGDGRYLLVAIQREFNGEGPVGGVRYTRIGRYDLMTDQWQFFLYPKDDDSFDTSFGEDNGFIGLSELSRAGQDKDGNDIYAVVERDQGLGAVSVVKRIYAFTLAGVTPTDGTLLSTPPAAGEVIQKKLLYDVLDAFAPFEKVEGLAFTRNNQLVISHDNDGGLTTTKVVIEKQVQGLLRQMFR